MLGTRPDIAFAVTKLAQYAANPSKDHLDKALYICRYLIGTQHTVLPMTEHLVKDCQHALTQTGPRTLRLDAPNRAHSATFFPWVMGHTE